MAFRAAALLVVLAGLAGCDLDRHYWRKPCEPDAAPGTCCPVGSHPVINDLGPDLIVCGADDPPCADAGADVGACPDASTDAH